MEWKRLRTWLPVGEILAGRFFFELQTLRLTQPAGCDQRFSFGRESRFSRDVPQSGNICAMDCAMKAGLGRRFSRRVNMMARRNPVKAPRNASVMERLLKVRKPWLVRMNPVYAIAAVQRITRIGNMGITF